jgi:antitoxin ParD1/3/4
MVELRHKGCYFMAASKSITLTLGEEQQVLDAMVASGDYESASEAARAAIQALVRERTAVSDVWRVKIQEALEDPQADIPADDVFAELRDHHETMVKASQRGA